MHQALIGWASAWAERGWTRGTLADAAVAGGLSLADTAAVAADPWRALERMADAADHAALESAGTPDSTATPRDRLFDLIMARFDALAPARAAHSRLLGEARTAPGLALAMATLVGRAAARMAGAAGVPTQGLGGFARVNAVAAILADTGLVWLSDDDPDLGQTMRRLDARLGLAERWAGRTLKIGSEPELDSVFLEGSSAAAV
ncbi:MAG: hypothetical protein RQ833_05875 [Sphingomonadaceae bacterium]|nr:hypothetical protein [Sphingomonadaceae bacterium]